MKSPGHREFPNHAVREQALGEPLQVTVDGNVLARSKNVIVVDEDGHRKRHYFPRSDVDMKQLQRTTKATECPFKGRAHYYSVRTGGRTLENAAWTYEEPYEEHIGLKDRLAFYDERDGIQVQSEASRVPEPPRFA